MDKIESRKEDERALHNLIRGECKDDTEYTDNNKYYTIASGSFTFVKNWLQGKINGKKVLDYCCGNGTSAIWLAEHGAQTVGIDISPVSIQNATEEALRRGLQDKVAFAIMDAENMKFDESTFDYIVINGVLHHLNLDKAYAELTRVLTPSGEAIAMESLKYNPIIQLYRKLTPKMRTVWEVNHILGKQEIEKAKEYFNEVRVERFCHLFSIFAIPFRNTLLFLPLLKFLHAIDSLLLRLPLIRWQAWMAIFVMSRPKKHLGS